MLFIYIYIFISNLTTIQHVFQICFILTIVRIHIQAKSCAEKDSTDEEILDGIDNMQDHLTNIAKHFLVFKAIPCHPGLESSMIVVRQSCYSINALRLIRSTDCLINHLNLYNIGIANITGDGANENVIFHHISCTVRLGDFVTPETKSLIEKYDVEEYLNYEVAKIDSYTGDYIFFMEDMPHLVKRLVNALYNSSKDDETRDIHYGDHHMNLRMIKQVWQKTGGTGAGVHGTRLTDAHFDKDNFSKMRVYLCVQVVSNSVLRMFTAAFNNPNINLPFKKHEYKPIIQFITHVNKFVDILNGRNDKNFIPETALSTIESLLEIFAWFHKWKKLNESLNLPANKFLPTQTWKGLERIIFDYIGMIDYYTIQRKMSLIPKRMTSDPCEHLFSRMRCCAGSTNSVTTRSALSTTAKQNLANSLKLPKNGSYAKAPSLSDTIIKNNEMLDTKIKKRF